MKEKKANRKNRLDKADKNRKPVYFLLINVNFILFRKIGCDYG